MEKNYNLILTQSDLDTLGNIFDIVFRAKGIEAANPNSPISLLLKKIQDTAFELPEINKQETEK